ncbi:uncharacterized protein CEXT_147011 [Caerostris extrusa]|uniref:Peptidase aspartic putative domain-containing protein n=1 Tax=Caerostris extrusa TaxID=172846 RepID=A0AAV4P6H8_CAEEX|nr:uncharacterized protein CEXT_147011 [Caerostris extrusa]
MTTHVENKPCTIAQQRKTTRFRSLHFPLQEKRTKIPFFCLDSILTFLLTVSTHRRAKADTLANSYETPPSENNAVNDPTTASIVDTTINDFTSNPPPTKPFSTTPSVIITNTKNQEKPCVSSWIQELRTKKIFLTDIQENAGPIEVLLGADVAGKLITGRREELETGLVALETKLGWTLMGKVP